MKGYDYSQPGYYYVTIYTQYRKKLFGEIDDATIRLNDAGQMIDQEWNQIPKRYRYVIIDKYVVMPDHFHRIVQIISNKNDRNSLSVGTSLVDVHTFMDVPGDADDINIPCKTGESAINRTGTRPVPTLFEIIGAFKSITTNQYINWVKQNN